MLFPLVAPPHKGVRQVSIAEDAICLKYTSQGVSNSRWLHILLPGVEPLWTRRHMQIFYANRESSGQTKFLIHHSPTWLKSQPNSMVPQPVYRASGTLSAPANRSIGLWVWDTNLGRRKMKKKRQNNIFLMLQEYQRKNRSLIFCEVFQAIWGLAWAILKAIWNLREKMWLYV